MSLQFCKVKKLFQRQSEVLLHLINILGRSEKISTVRRLVTCIAQLWERPFCIAGEWKLRLGQRQINQLRQLEVVVIRIFDLAGDTLFLEGFNYNNLQ